MSRGVRRRCAWSTTPRLPCPASRGGRGTMARWRSVTGGAILRGRASWSGLAHEPLARGAHERHRLGEEQPHGVAERDRLLVDAALRLHLGKRGGGQLDGGVERERRELLALRLLHGLGLLLGELAQTAHQVLRVAPERESEAATTFHALSLAAAVVQEERSLLRPVAPCTRVRPRRQALPPSGAPAGARRRKARRKHRR